MEQDKHTVIDPPASELPAWPGQRLREAREALNLSHQDIAGKLRLDVGLIQALENNNQEALPAQTYLVGYLRSYARLVNLPADSIIVAAGLTPQPASSLFPETINYRARRRFEPLLHLLWLGMLACLVLIAGFWILSLGPEWLNQWLNQVSWPGPGSHLPSTPA